MLTKISSLNNTIFTFILLSLFLIGCNSSDLEYSVKTTLNPNKISPLTATLDIKTDVPCSIRVKVLGDIPLEQSIQGLKN